jgi:hypothetical protein
MRGVIPPLHYEWSSRTDVIKGLGMYVTTEVVSRVGGVSCIFWLEILKETLLGKPRRRWWDNNNTYGKGIVQRVPGV